MQSTSPENQEEITSFLHEGVKHLEAQRLAEAEQCCRRVLELAPHHADAQHILGIIALQGGRFTDACDLLASACRHAAVPSAQMHFHHALALQVCGSLEAAAVAYGQVLDLQQDMAEAHCNLGQVLRELGRAEQAMAHAEAAVSLQPEMAMGHFHLALTRQALGQHEAALGSYRRLLVLQPDMAAAHNNCGQVLRDLGQLEESVACCRQAIVLQPLEAVSHFNLAVSLQQLGDIDGALAAYRQAVALRPDYVDALNNLGILLQRRGDMAAAEASYRAALQCQQDNVDTLCNLGAVLHLQGKSTAAVACYRQALTQRADAVVVLRNLGAALQSLGRLDEALELTNRLLELQPDSADDFTQYLLLMQYRGDLDPAALFAAHRQFAERFERPLRAAWRPHDNVPDVARRLRVGYVSPDFRNHAVAHFIEPVLANHDRAAVEVYGYYTYDREDDVTARLRGLCDHWRPSARITDAELAERIRTDGIDILVDLSGHTAGNRLLAFARKPAPVQLTWLGYPGTTGLQAMDYRLTDASMDPEGESDAFNSEQLIRLPASCSFRPAENLPPVSPLPALANGYLTFACLNNLIKINPHTVALWGRVLMAVPGSRMILGNAGDPDVQARLAAWFSAAGVAVERLEFVPRLGLMDYLALHQRIDIALDTFPYTGGTTSSHALAMGVPVMTRVGRTTASRQTATVLHALGLSEFIANDEADYLQQMLALLADLPRLDGLRQSLRDRMAAAPGPDPLRLTRALEQAYAAAWRAWCEGRR